MVALLEEMQFAVWTHLLLHKYFGVLVAEDGVLFAVEHHDWEVEPGHVLFDPIYCVEEGFGHFGAEEGNHEAVLEDIMEFFVVFGEGGWVYHSVDDKIL